LAGRGDGGMQASSSKTSDPIIGTGGQSAIDGKEISGDRRLDKPLVNVFMAVSPSPRCTDRLILPKQV